MWILSFLKQLSELTGGSFGSAEAGLTFEPGNVIFKNGSPLTHFGYIFSGFVKVVAENKPHNNIILKILKQGDLADEPGFLFDGKHHFSLKCITETQVYLIDSAAINNIICRNQHFAIEFIRWQNKAHAFLMSRLESMTRKQMPGRIADTLLYLSKEIYSSAQFQTHLTRQDMADMSSMAKESAIRILQKFKSDNLIDFHLNLFSIIHPERLEEISINGQLSCISKSDIKD